MEIIKGKLCNGCYSTLSHNLARPLGHPGKFLPIFSSQWLKYRRKISPLSNR